MYHQPQSMYPDVIAFLSKNARRKLKHTCRDMYKLVMSSYAGKVVLKGRPGDKGLERDVKGLISNCLEAGLRLSHFEIEDSRYIVNISPLSELTHLQRLVCNGMDSVADIGLLAALTNLTHLDFSYMENMMVIRPVAAFPQLWFLDCSGMDSVTDIRPLAALMNLRYLKCSRMHEVADISPLSALTNLEFLDCSRMRNVTDEDARRSLTPRLGKNWISALRFFPRRGVSERRHPSPLRCRERKKDDEVFCRRLRGGFADGASRCVVGSRIVWAVIAFLSRNFGVFVPIIAELSRNFGYVISVS